MINMHTADGTIDIKELVFKKKFIPGSINRISSIIVNTAAVLRLPNSYIGYSIKVANRHSKNSMLYPGNGKNWHTK